MQEGKLSTQTKWQNRRSNLGRKQKAYPNQYPGRGGADVLDVCFGSGKGKTAYTIYSIVGFVASAGQQFFELKMATAQDLHKVRTRRSNVTYELQRAESGRELTRMSLCHLIGLELDAQIIATDTLILTQNYNNQLSHDIVNRPEYRIQEMQVELKDLEIKNTRADFFPTVGISAGYQYMGGMKLAGSSLDMKIPMVMASISIPIFNFGEGRKK